MDEKICVKCATKNEEHFVYCKYCGAPLPVVDRRAPVSDIPDTGSDGDTVAHGISRREYSIYVGKNAGDIVPSFEALQQSGKKASWCTPVFVLGLFFGFYGIAAWFFSRKMIKTGFILTAVGVFLTAADALVNMEMNRTLYNGLLYGGANYLYTSLYYCDPVSLSALPNIVFSFLASIFALHSYKAKATRDILELKSVFVEDESLPMHISSAGGRKTALGLVPLIIGIAVSILTFAVTVI